VLIININKDRPENKSLIQTFLQAKSLIKKYDEKSEHPDKRERADGGIPDFYQEYRGFA